MSEVDILGIDLGTTNSAIAIWEAETGQARILSKDNNLRSQLRIAAETAKIALTQTTEYQINIPNILEVTLTRSQLEKLVQPFIESRLNWDGCLFDEYGGSRLSTASKC